MAGKAVTPCERLKTAERWSEGDSCLTRFVLQHDLISGGAKIGPVPVRPGKRPLAIIKLSDILTANQGGEKIEINKKNKSGQYNNESPLPRKDTSIRASSSICRDES